MESAKPLINLVIPVFRNQLSILPLYNKLQQVFSEKLEGYSYHIIFVNDGSDDGSAQVIDNIIELGGPVTQITFSRNFGQVAAIIAGLKNTNGDATIIMSADMQEPIHLVGDMVNAWQRGNEIIIAKRINRKDSLQEKIFSVVFYRIITLAMPNMPKGGFDFVLLDKAVVAELNRLSGHNRFLQGDILWTGFQVTFIPYEKQKRASGRSQIKLPGKIKYLIDGVISSSFWPIRLMSFIGLFMAVFGLFYTAIIFYMKYKHQTPFKGWAPIMVLILMLSGLIMLMLGIIGEYIWRIYDEVRNRPLYIIREKKKGEK